MISTDKIRNICIIAHVDHGKTTLVDHLLRQAGTFHRDAGTECIMDSGDLERERGITILAKNASIRLDDVKVNIVDTPGHADFGGEVERIMSMVDGAILLVDAAEGPLPQTRFVLEKALKQGLKVVLFVNKVDRSEVQGNERISEVVNHVFDLFVDCGASDEQADFPILYASGRQGWCTRDIDAVPKFLADPSSGSLKPLFELLIDFIPPPPADKGIGFQMLVTNLQYSEFVGQMSIGRVRSGAVKRGDRIIRYFESAPGKPAKESFQVSRLYTFQGLSPVEVEVLGCGDVGMIAGCEVQTIGDTFAENDSVPALPRIAVEPPTLAMIFAVNTTPNSGRDGEAVQSRKLRERLERETRQNVAMRLEDTRLPDQFRMLGRGELQFAILIEQMRREGIEFMVGRPQVLMQRDESGSVVEPMERVMVDIPEEYTGEVSELLQQRKGIMTGYENLVHASALGGGARVRVVYEIPSRGLLGMRSRFMTATRGEGIMNTELIGYGPHKGPLPHRINGALISDRSGQALEYALLTLEARGMLFISPGVDVYEGMIIGECSRGDDLDVNPCKEKKLSNVRSATKEAFETLKGIRKMTLEQCIEWIEDDEWIEVTPNHVRVRKKVLNKTERHVARKRDANDLL